MPLIEVKLIENVFTVPPHSCTGRPSATPSPCAHRITVEHVAARKRIDVVGYVTVESQGEASRPGDVQCGISGFDHPGTEFYGDVLQSADRALRWEIRGRRNASFFTDFDYRSAVPVSR